MLVEEWPGRDNHDERESRSQEADVQRQLDILEEKTDDERNGLFRKVMLAHGSKVVGGPFRGWGGKPIHRICSKAREQDGLRAAVPQNPTRQRSDPCTLRYLEMVTNDLPFRNVPYRVEKLVRHGCVGGIDRRRLRLGGIWYRMALDFDCQDPAPVVMTWRVGGVFAFWETQGMV